MFLIRLLLCVLLFSQPACSQKNDKAILLLNASVHQGNGEVIENAALAFKGEKITLLADARRIRLDMSAFEVIEAYGLQIYPASLADALPATVSERDSLYHTSINNSGKVVLTTAKVSADLPMQVLEEGAEATFVVTEQVLHGKTAQIRYLFVKGKMKQENDVSLHLSGAGQ